jgi:hypothetical protein
MATLKRTNASLISQNKKQKTTYRIGSVDKLAGFAELDHGLPQVGQGAFNQNLLLLVMIQQMVPQRLLTRGKKKQNK